MPQTFSTTIPAKQAAPGKAKPAVQVVKPKAPRTARKRSMSLLGLLAVLAVLTGIIAYVAVRVLTASAQEQVDQLESSIIEIQDTFDADLLATITRLDQRLDAGEELMRNHTSYLPFFVTLEELTLRDVRFYGASLDRQTDRLSMVLEGEAASFLTIAYQSQLFSENAHFGEHIFSDFSLQEDGLVSFRLDITVPPSLVRFVNSYDEFYR